MDLNITVGGDDIPTKKETTGIRETRGKGRGDSDGKWGDIKLTKYSDIKWRLNARARKVKKFTTGIPELDKVLGGGLAVGLNTFLGDGGSGKSLMAREISKNHKTLYLCCEVMSDAPDSKEYPNVTAVDYTQYLVKPHKAIAELFTFIEELQPELIVIDSMTSFFSQSNKALPESDVREMVWKVHQAADNKIPIIGISEIRGQGYNRGPAGGQGVKHGCSMLLDFRAYTILSESQINLFGASLGDIVYQVQVYKDKAGKSSVYPHRLYWTETGGYKVNRIESISKNG